MSRAGLLLAVGAAALAVRPAPARAQAPDTTYAAYPWPGACVAVARRTGGDLAWGALMDTMPYDEGRLPAPGVRQAAGACLARVLPDGPRAATAPRRDLAALYFLGRLQGDDTLATDAAEQVLRGQRVLDDSINVLWNVLRSNAWALPRRPATVRRLALRLDTLGVLGERPFLPDDSAWSSQHQTPLQLAVISLDTATARAELRLARRNLAALPASARGGTEGAELGLRGQELLLEFLHRPRADSLVQALRARAVALYGPAMERSPIGAGLQYLGRPYPALHPEFWFHRPAGAATQPRPGHITLIQMVDPPSGYHENMAAALHRLKARFGDAVDVILLATTRGHFAGRVQLAPAEEAQLLAEQILGEWKVDATVGVYVTPHDTLPAPDRRRIPRPIPELNDALYGGGAMVIDQRGHLILADVISISSATERALHRLLARLLDLPDR